MNIADTGQVNTAAQAQQAAAAQSTDNARYAEAAQPEPAQQSAAQQSAVQATQDEYVPDPPKAVSNALYSISDIRKGVISEINAQMKIGKRTASGEKIDRKIAEMVLPTGRKSLTIYSKSSG